MTELFTAEHHSLYQYNLVHAKDHYMGLIQTETVGPLHHFSYSHLNVTLLSSHTINRFPLLLVLSASMIATMILHSIPTPSALGLYGSSHRITYSSSVSPSNISIPEVPTIPSPRCRTVQFFQQLLAILPRNCFMSTPDCRHFIGQRSIHVFAVHCWGDISSQC